MFPSSGFFKGVVCPYLTSGLCERPYCHYKHSDVPSKTTAAEKRTTIGPSAAAAAAAAEVSSLTMIDQTSKLETFAVNSSSDASQTAGRQMPSMLNMMGSAISRVQTRGSAENLLSYRPTPKATAKTAQATVTIPTSRTKDGTLEYTPTPIHLLKQSKPRVNTLQYDPVINYSTEMRPLGNGTRVTLADAERSSVKRSVEEIGDRCVKKAKITENALAIEAKFSEDEGEVEKGVKKEDDSKSSVQKLQKDEGNKLQVTNVVEVDQTSVAEDEKRNSAFGCTSVSESNVTDAASSSRQDCLNGLRTPDAVSNSGKPIDLPDLKAVKDTVQEEMSKETVVDVKPGSPEIHSECDTKNTSSSKGNKTGQHREHLKETADKEKKRVDSGSGGKHADMARKENKKLSPQEPSKSTNHIHHHHHHSSRIHDKHDSKDGKSDDKGSKKHSDNGHQESKEHIYKKHSSKHSRQDESSNKEKHSKDGSRHNCDKTKDFQSNDEKFTKGSHKENGKTKVSSKSPKCLSTEENVQDCNVEDRDKKTDKTVIKNNQQHTAISRRPSEHGRSRSTEGENCVGEGSTEEAMKKVKRELGSENGDCLTAKNISPGKVEKSRRSSETLPAPSHSRHLASSSASSQSRKVASKGSHFTLNIMKRSISHVELFGEDSDTEKELPTKRSAPAAISGKDDDRCKKLHVSSQDSEDHDSDVSFGDADSTLNDSPGEELDRFEECRRLFLEDSKQFKKSAMTPVVAKEAKNFQNSLDESPVGKKRVAHGPGNNFESRRLQPVPKRFQPSASKTMMDRYHELQKAAELSKKLSNEAKAVQSNNETSVAVDCASTSSTASLKIKQRVAHVPKSGDFLQKPILSVDGVSKLPVKVRQLCLEKIFHECVNIYDVADDAKERALSEEKTAYEKSTTKSIYLNLISNAVKRLRDESPLSKTLSPKNPKAMSHEAILGGSKAATTSFTINRWGKPLPLPKSFSDSELYKRLLIYVLSESQLVDNSFPRTNPDQRDEVVIKRSERDLQTPQSSDANQKFCRRCGKAFVVLPNGSFAQEEECLYHWGHAWKQRVGGTFDNIYNCCGSDLSSRGCQVSKCHVHEENKYKCLSGYMATIPSSPREDGNYGVYALDCEMVYTTFGCELARVTIIGPKLDLVLDKIVKPDHEVIDYNTRFSGLTAEDLKNVTTSIRDIQAILLHMFNDKTILIGHSLESDLVALKLVHNTVVDTSVVFPHRRGLPFKRALQNVVKETLQKIIQNSISGHDSSEDARSCMELMLWKVKEDAKRSNRYV